MSGADSGAELAEAYHRSVVAPLILARWPGLRYAAGRLGSGSDVLGYDDAMSRDHDWGLRLNVLVPPEPVEAVRGYLRETLPSSYAGLPTRFATTWLSEGDVGVQVDAVPDFLTSRLGVDPLSGMGAADWLALTGQSVLEVTAGPVFADLDGSLTRARTVLGWYPEDVWRYVVAADWARLAQELPVASRAGDRGDETGARVVTARLVGTAMHLAFLLQRRWPPYPKWRGTAFARLPCAAVVGPALAAVLDGPTWRVRQDAMATALEAVATVQRRVGLPTPDRVVGRFFDRPYAAVVDETVSLLRSGVGPEVAALPWGVGSVEQWVDSVDVLTSPALRVSAVRAVLRPEG